MPVIVWVWEELDAPELLLGRLIPRQGIRSQNHCVRSGNHKRNQDLEDLDDKL